MFQNMVAIILLRAIKLMINPRSIIEIWSISSKFILVHFVIVFVKKYPNYGLTYFLDIPQFNLPTV